jgi:hypothetical protein
MLLSFELKKLLVFNVNGVLCYFPPLTIMQRNAKVFGKNVDKTKVEIKIGINIFLSKAFQKFHITIWSCMKFEDVLEVLPMFVLESFLE